MKSIPYSFYVTDLQLEPRVVDLRSDRSVPLSRVLEPSVSHATDPSLAVMNAAIDLYNSERDQNGSRSEIV